MSVIKRLKSLKRDHFSPIKTIIFNFKVFPLKLAVKLPVFLYGSVSFEDLRKGCIVLKKPKTGGIKFGAWYTGMFGTSQLYKSHIRIAGTLVLGEDVVLAEGFIISVSKGAIVDIGSNVSINRNVKIHSKQKVVIGDNCRFGWDVTILDTNFHYSVSDGKIHFRHHDVYIGHNTWLTNSVSVMRGGVLPPYSVVASRSLVNKDFSGVPEKTLFGGCPAKPIKSNVFRILVKEWEVDKLFNGREWIDYDELGNI